MERILFGLVANRALAPSSKLAATDWIENDVRIDGLSAVGDDACYRAMDALLAVAQMPPGVPVAAVGVDNPKNAAALAARILSA